LLNEANKGSNIEENYHFSEFTYQKITLRDKRPFSWENGENNPLLLEELPTRLYNVKEKYLENFRTGEITNTNYQLITDLKTTKNIKSYALLSYV